MLNLNDWIVLMVCVGLLEVRCRLLMGGGMLRRMRGLQRLLYLVRYLCWLLGSS